MIIMAMNMNGGNKLVGDDGDSDDDDTDSASLITLVSSSTRLMLRFPLTIAIVKVFVSI